MLEAGLNDLLQVAKVLKSNGTDGGLLVSFRDILPEDIDLEEPVFIIFDGLPVPFFISDLSRRGSAKAIVHLNDISNLKDAEEVVGRDVYVSKETYEVESDEEDYSFLVGWTLKGVGPITDYVDIPGNPCIEVKTSKGSSLVPLHDDFILSVDESSRTLTMSLPDGLLDI